MHIYMITRGIKHDVDRFINELSALYLPFTFHKKKKLIQTAVRPIQLWEVVFPKEHQDQMLATLFHGGKVTQHKKHEKWVALLRKVLGIKKIPEYDASQEFAVYGANIEKVAIGIKDDYEHESGDGTEML